MRWLMVVVLVLAPVLAAPVSALAAEEASETGSEAKAAEQEKHKAHAKEKWEHKSPEQEEHERLAREASKWHAHTAKEIDELKRNLKDAPEGVREALERYLAVRERQLGALGEKIEAHKAGDWKRVEEADKALGPLEEEQQALGLDLEEAGTVAELEERAKAHGVPEAAEPLVEQIRENFKELRQVRRQIAQLHKEEAKLHRQRAIIMKRLEIAVLEAEVGRMEASEESE